jgi:hypothetical protein
MNRYRFNSNNNNNNNFDNYKQPVNGNVDQDEVANRFKDYIIKLFNINNETVTKLEKSRVKQIYFNQFQIESQSIKFQIIEVNLKKNKLFFI